MNQSGNAQHTSVQKGAAPTQTQYDSGVASTPESSTTSDAASAATEYEQIDWRRQWYAVHPIDSIPADRPWGFKVMGRALVAWKDGEGEWRVFDDACPHRKVALSEGRKEADGTLACAYHGWRFDGQGQCTLIPQLEGGGLTGPGERTRMSPPAGATSFPCQVAGGLLFVFMVPGADGLLQCLDVPVPAPQDLAEKPSEPGKARWVAPWFARELPMSVEVLMENALDPCHVSFAHHGLAPFLKRDKPSVYPYDRVDKQVGKAGYIVGASKFGYAMEGLSRVQSRNVQDQTFFPSMSANWVFKTEPDQDPNVPVEYLLEGTPFMCQTFYFTPVTATTCKVITRSDSHTESIAKWLLGDLRPTWISHLFSELAITDGDMSLLHRQSWEINNGALSHKDYFMPAKSDKGVVTLWQHLKKHSEQGVNYYPHSPDLSLLDPSQALERYRAHVKDCVDCSKALKIVETWRWVMAVAAVMAALLTAVFATQEVGAAALLVGGASTVVAAFVSTKLHALRKHFFYVPYVHQEHN